MPNRILSSNRPLALRATLVFFLVLLLPGCLQDKAVQEPLADAFVGHRATYGASADPAAGNRDLTYTLIRTDESGYLIHLQVQGREPLDQGDFVFHVDTDGFIVDDIQLCESRTEDGSCAWGDYHSFESWGRGLPFLCGALIPQEGTYVRTDIMGHIIETSVDIFSTGERVVATTLETDQRFTCTLSGSYPPDRIATDPPPPGTYRGMVLRNGDPPFEIRPSRSTFPSAPALERSPTEVLDEIPETSFVSAEETINVLRERSAAFASFIASNPSGITPVVNAFREAGSVALGPTVGPIQQPLGREQHYQRELVFFGRDTGDVYRGVVQGSNLRAMDANASLPRDSWVIAEEESAASGYQAWSPLRDNDGEILSPRLQLPYAMERARELGIVEGRVISASYRPTWSEPYVSEVESLDACVDVTDGRASGGTVGLLYRETVCISTATGEITQATGDWSLVRQAGGLPDLNWHELIR